jgi:hypothetical protein
MSLWPQKIGAAYFAGQRAALRMARDVDACRFRTRSPTPAARFVISRVRG